MNFLKRFKQGKPDMTELEAYKKGFLRFTYDPTGMIENISWSRSKLGTPQGLQLFFDWANERVTFKTKMGLSGVEWSDGVDLAAWVDECIEEMVEP